MSTETAVDAVVSVRDWMSESAAAIEKLGRQATLADVPSHLLVLQSEVTRCVEYIQSASRRSQAAADSTRV